MTDSSRQVSPVQTQVSLESPPNSTSASLVGSYARSPPGWAGGDVAGLQQPPVRPVPGPRGHDEATVLDRDGQQDHLLQMRVECHGAVEQGRRSVNGRTCCPLAGCEHPRVREHCRCVSATEQDDLLPDRVERKLVVGPMRRRCGRAQARPAASRPRTTSGPRWHRQGRVDVHRRTSPSARSLRRMPSPRRRTEAGTATGCAPATWACRLPGRQGAPSDDSWSRRPRTGAPPKPRW